MDETLPARSAALGGNSSASPKNTSSLVDNPAGLAGCDHYLAAARYQRLMEGIEEDDLGTGSVAVLGPLGTWGGWGASWDHFGADHLQRDRFRIAGGRALPVPSRLGRLSLGLSLSLLSQRYTLSEPLRGLLTGDFSATAFSFGAGVLWRPWARLSIGVAGEDLTRPNLGVLGVERYEPSLRCGVAYETFWPRFGTVVLLAGAQRADSSTEPQGGVEWTHPRAGLSLRAGYQKRQASVGLGFNRGAFTLDYAYIFSSNEAASLDGVGLPANHLFELMWGWGGRLTPEDPDSYAALMKKAVAEEKASRWNEALWTYRRAYQKSPLETPAKEGWERSLSAYNRERAERYLTYGQEAELRGFATEAQHNYEWALQLDPTSQEIQTALERIKASAPSGAMADSRVVKWLQEAAAFSAQGDKTQADLLLQKARQQYPGDTTLQAFSKLLTTAPITETPVPSDPAVARLLAEAEIYQHKGRADLATDSWRRILTVDPKNQEAAEKLKAARSPQPAAQSVSTSDRRKAQALYEHGLKMYLDGEVREAIQDWEEALSFDPSHENALNNLARARLEVSRYGPSPERPSPTPEIGATP